MKRRHGPGPDAPCEVHFPLSIVDMLSVMLLCLVVSQMVAEVQRQRLPGLRTSAKDRAGATGGTGGPGIELKADGQLVYEKVPITLDELVRRLNSEPLQGRPVPVSIETGADGRGALEAWLQLQADLTRAGLWGRVEVLTRPRTVSAGGNEP